jgi:hypothetical protein
VEQGKSLARSNVARLVEFVDQGLPILVDLGGEALEVVDGPPLDLLADGAAADERAYFHGDARSLRDVGHERDVLGVGVETVGTDAGRAATFDPPFPNHYVMHGSGKFGLAGLCNLDQLPPTGAVVIAAPLKIVNGSGSPLRVIAITP